MLKNIRLHIDKEENKQAQLDEKLAKQIIETHNSNINAFQRNIPSLKSIVQHTELVNYSVFINKFGENNIVDYGMGRTFYGFHPEQEVLEQISQIEQHCPEITFQTQPTNDNKDSVTTLSIETLPSARRRSQQPPMRCVIDCLVVLGCGLGIHLSHLLKRHKIKNLVIYEPELQYFQCSVLVTSWQEIFTLAKVHNTAIFLQLGKDGRNLIQDMNELIKHTAISSFQLYKHYNHKVFDSLYKNISEQSWREIEHRGFKIHSTENYLDFLPSWTSNLNLADHTVLHKSNDELTRNLAAFKQYFPDIYQEFKDYTPQKWLPVSNARGEINLLKIDSLHTWYGYSPKKECTLNFESFNEQPNKDGLSLGYSGTKLAHYIHYKFVKETEAMLKEAEDEVGSLPDNVPSIIMFGLGVGYQLEKLLEEHSVEKLFICEPNPDFFYASLFAIDWQTIFDTVQESGARIYLNVGDDGTNLFKDLLSQFYAIGPYILNSTYFYQSYYNASLNSAISQLREQLQVVISMGEYFDHAYYGIAHTTEGIRRKIPLLTANPTTKIGYDDKKVPIFVVGNGPSLDNSIDAIKEWQGRAIIISCGTALQALHRHNITPDFHAEIEQNRCTFDWAVLIGDLDYLKKITLLSCNGIHPDTCDLYKDVMIAFKGGESATISALNVLGQENYTTLLNAFPTVSNFAIDLFSTIGFTSIYLIGVDLGFVDVKHHHSKSSGYYQEDGKEIYDYAERENTALSVPGNFRPNVNTKYEFKVSRQVIEQVTAAKPQGQDFYNCSDGAKIQGCMPIRLDDLLIVATPQQKRLAIEKLTTEIFSSTGLDNYVEKFEVMFSQELLIKELTAFETLLEKDITCREDVEYIINEQKEMLFNSYHNSRSLLFYYMYGTVNYTNAVLTKSLHLMDNTADVPEIISHTKELWTNTLGNIRGLITANEENDFDVSYSQLIKRNIVCLQQHCREFSLLIVTDSKQFSGSLDSLLKSQFSWIHKVDILNTTELETYTKVPDYAIFDLEDIEGITIKGKRNTIATIKSEEDLPWYSSDITYLKTSTIQNEHIFYNPTIIARIAIIACISDNKCNLILPKYRASESLNIGEQVLESLNDSYEIYDNFYYFCLFSKSHEHIPKGRQINGTRAKKIHSPLKVKDLIWQVVPLSRVAHFKKMAKSTIY